MGYIIGLKNAQVGFPDGEFSKMLISSLHIES